MKPFDLEAAKRGEPIEMLLCNEWQSCRFVGMSSDGHPVVETSKPAFVAWTADKLRMAPRITTLVIEMWRDSRGRYWFTATDQCGAPHGGSPYAESKKVATFSYVVSE